MFPGKEMRPFMDFKHEFMFIFYNLIIYSILFIYFLFGVTAMHFQDKVPYFGGVVT